MRFFNAALISFDLIGVVPTYLLKLAHYARTSHKKGSCYSIKRYQLLVSFQMLFGRSWLKLTIFGKFVALAFAPRNSIRQLTYLGAVRKPHCPSSEHSTSDRPLSLQLDTA